MHYYRSDGLIAHEVENGSSVLFVDAEIDGRHPKIEDEMQHDCSDDDRHGSASDGYWIAHICQLVHEHSEPYGYECHYKEYNVLDNGFEYA